MKAHRVDPARLQAFAEAYAPSVRQAVDQLRSWTGDLSKDDYAVAMTVEMVAAVERAGIAGIEHYYLNTKGGALRLTASALGVEVEQLDIYLRGGTA